MGGGEMSSGAFRCVATAGQTAAGFMTSPDYWALVGYWLPGGQVGIKELVEWSSGQVKETKLYSPYPVPFRSRVFIRYSLATDEPATLQAYDGVGRLVRSWAVSHEPSAVSFVAWDGTDARGRGLANGVYFLKLSAGPPAGARAGDFRQTEKLVLQR